MWFSFARWVVLSMDVHPLSGTGVWPKLGQWGASGLAIGKCFNRMSRCGM